MACGGGDDFLDVEASGLGVSVSSLNIILLDINLVGIVCLIRTSYKRTNILIYVMSMAFINVMAYSTSYGIY